MFKVLCNYIYTCDDQITDLYAIGSCESMAEAKQIALNDIKDYFDNCCDRENRTFEEMLKEWNYSDNDNHYSKLSKGGLYYLCNIDGNIGLDRNIYYALEI